MDVRAIAIDRFGGPEILKEIGLALPEPGPGEVRLRVACAAVNPADLLTRAGRTIAPADARFPMVLGWDAAGTVESAPPGSELAVGERVAVMTMQVVDQRGTYAEGVVVNAADVARIPAALDDATAAAVPLAGLTALQGIEKLAPAAGTTLVVNGALGALGRFAVQLAAARGAEVVAVVRDGDHRLAHELGAAAVVDSDGDVPAAVEAALGGQADAAFDLVGGGAARDLLASVREGGTFVSAVNRHVDPTGPFEEERGIKPRPVYVRPDRAQLQSLLDLTAAGELRVPVAEQLPLADAAQAHRLLAAGGLRGKIVLVV